MSRRVGRALALVLAGGLALSAGGAALAAPVGALKQFKVPTANGSPEHITQASDGSFWFTESSITNQNASPHKVGRITPTGQITEFTVCDFCFPTDIVQGSDGLMYFTKNDATLGRITTSGQVLSDIPAVFSPNGNGMAAHGNEIWVTDFNNDVLWRYDIPTDTFTRFETDAPGENTDPLDVTVAPDGTVWFVEGDGRIGRLDPSMADDPATPQHENITQIDVDGFPREISVASDGVIWFTEQFPPSAVGRINPTTNAVVALTPTDGQPLGIAPAADGSMWVTRFNAGDIIRISPNGVVTAQSKAVKGSGPSGIVVPADGNPWFTMLESNKIANFQLR